MIELSPLQIILLALIVIMIGVPVSTEAGRWISQKINGRHHAE